MNTDVRDMVARVRPEYYIVKDEPYEYLIWRDADGKPNVFRSANREQVYGKILSELHACVYEATAGEMLEGVFEEPRQRPHEFEPRRLPKSMFTKPEQESQEVEQVCKDDRKRSSRFDGHSLEPYCPAHLRDKYRDGKTRGGKQKYRCPQCDRKEPAATTIVRAKNGAHRRNVQKHSSKNGGGWSIARAKHVSDVVSKNPLCGTCGEHLRVFSRYKNARGATVTRWQCAVNGCQKSNKISTVEELSGEELRRLVRAAVVKVNGHNPQQRDDIVQELIRAFLAGDYTLKQLLDPKTIRAVIRGQADQYQDKYKRLSLDAPVGKDEGRGQTFADRLESQAMNPEEELMAKEVGGGEMAN